MLTEKAHTGSFIISELDGHGSRDNIVIVSGQNLVAGTVLGNITATPTKYAAYDQQAGTGIEVGAGILYASVDATSADTPGVIINRSAEVNGNQLIWPAGSPTDITAGIADLRALGIKVRY